MIGSPAAQQPALGAFPTSTQNSLGAGYSSSGHSPTTCSPALRAAHVFDEPRSVLRGWANFRGDMSRVTLEFCCKGSLNSAVHFHLIYVPTTVESQCPKPTTSFLSPPLHLPFAFAQGRPHPAHLSCGIFHIHTGNLSDSTVQPRAPRAGCMAGGWAQAP